MDTIILVALLGLTMFTGIALGALFMVTRRSVV